MKHGFTTIAASAATAFEPWPEPTAADLDAIERELPLILAEVDELDVRIAVMDRPASELDERRLRRAAARVLAARTVLANRPCVELSGGAA
ncbi:DUF6284 family protein [Streptomyces tsukubensis]|uniref:DUF6284 family protein n=1 Tax=Streptomyces tsukubensis TaxID=83656 RepID=UPI0036837830